MTQPGIGELSVNVDRIAKHPGRIWYVNASGNNSNDGQEPDQAFATLTYALAQMSAGDMLVVGANTYNEAVTIALNSIAVQFELGTIIVPPAASDGLTISGNYNKIYAPYGALRINAVAGQAGVTITGNFNYLWSARVPAASTADLGFDIQGDGCVLDHCRCSSPLVAAFKIQGDKNLLEVCCTGGDPGDSSIGFWVTNSCDKTRLRACGSGGHETAGFQLDLGVSNTICCRCESGAGDGHPIDNGINTFLDLEYHDTKERHEHTYPSPDGEGTAGDTVTVQSEINDETGADTTKDYYGDVAMILPPDTVTTGYRFKGVNFFATTTNDDQRFFFYRCVAITKAVRNGGNNWDENQTVLTVDDASPYETNDLVWIRSTGYVPDGEIVKITNIAGNVITIARQTENSGRLGLHWDHTTNDPGGEEMYLCWRDENQYHSSDMDFSAQTARSFAHQPFVRERRMSANDAIVTRMVNGTDDANSQCDVSIIWVD